MNGRLLVGAAALSILLGLSVAYCDHRGDGEDLGPCAGVAYAVPAATKTPKGNPPPRREVWKEPHREERRQDVRKTSPQPSASSSARRNHIDLDLDMDGC